jgi:hypothetical protein
MDTPALKLLMGGYFHQDWYDENQDEWANVDEFLASEPLAVQLPAEIARVLEAMPTDEQVKTYLAGLGSCYVADSDGYRPWLRRIAERVQQGLAP